MPGMAASTSETWLLGSPPNSVEAPENSLALEVTWACTSMPMTTSQSPVAPLRRFVSVGMNRHVTLCASRSVLSRPAASIHAMLAPDVALPPARSDDHGRPPWRSASRLSARSHHRRRPDLHLASSTAVPARRAGRRRSRPKSPNSARTEACICSRRKAARRAPDAEWPRFCTEFAGFAALLGTGAAADSLAARTMSSMKNETGSLGLDPRRLGGARRGRCSSSATAVWAARPPCPATGICRRSRPPSRNNHHHARGRKASGRLLDHLRRAKTASPRRTAGRSAAGRAAGPARRGPPAPRCPASPAMFTVTVNTSFKYISTGSAPPFSPRPKAADGVAGVSMASMPCAKALLEVALDQRAHLLRAQIIGVVIAGRQHIGADHHAPAHLLAETFGARLLVHVGDVAASTRRP